MEKKNYQKQISVSFNNNFPLNFLFSFPTYKSSKYLHCMSKQYVHNQTNCNINKQTYIQIMIITNIMMISFHRQKKSTTKWNNILILPKKNNKNDLHSCLS